MRTLFPATTALLAGLLILGCDGGDAGTSTSTTGSTSTTATSSGASGAKAAAATGEVLARVNGIVVTVEEFESAASRKSPSSGDALNEAEKQEVLDSLVAEKLLYEAALKQGLDKDPKVQKVMVNSLLREDVYSSVRNSDFTDAELEAYFEANKDEFIVPEKIQVKRILIKVNDERSDEAALALAKEVRAKLSSDGSNFKEVATEFSEDPYRRRGGDVGFVPKTGKPGLDPKVVEQAFTMGADEMSAPFRSSEGYNIVFVANKRERVERSFQQMKGSVLRKVKNERLKSLYEEYVAKLRNGADVQVNQDKLAAVTIESRRRSLGPGFGIDPSGDGPELSQGGDLPGLEDEE